MNSQWSAYLSHAEDTLPMPTTRRLPELYDDTLILPAIQRCDLHIDGYDAALLIALAHESGVSPETLVRRMARLTAYGRQLEQEART